MKSLKILILLSFVSLALLIFRIDYQSLWVDEMMSLNIAQRPLGSMMILFRALPEQHPLYYLLLKGWLFFGTSEAALRSLSAVFALASLWAIYFFARDLLGNQVAKVTAALLCFSPFYLYYGQEARPYVLLCLLAIVNSHAFFLCIHRPSRASRVAHVVTGILGVYTHLFFLFLVVGHFGFLIIRDRRIGPDLPKVGAQQGLVILSYIPWIWMLFLDLPGGTRHFWKGIEHIVFGIPYTFLRFALGYSEFIANYQWRERIPELLMANAGILILGFVVIGTLAASGLYFMRKAGKSGLFVMCCLILPFAPALLISFWVILVSERYFIACFPFYLMVVAAGICGLWQAEGKWKTAGVALTALFVLLSGICLYDYYFNPNFGKEQWRDTAHYLEENSQDEDVIVFRPGFVIELFSYYYRGDQDLLDSEQLGMADLRDLDRYWMVIAHSPDIEKYRESLAETHKVAKNELFPFESGIRVLLMVRDDPILDGQQTVQSFSDIPASSSEGETRTNRVLDANDR